MKLSHELSRQCATTRHDLLSENFHSNRMYIKAARGVDLVRNTEAGEKVIVVGAGPSLDAALPLLVGTRHTIIACDRAVGPLLAAGIRPDWIVTVEILGLAKDKLRDLGPKLIGVKLAFDPLCCPETVHNYPGPLYTWNKPTEVNDKGYLRLGTGVVTYAVGLAEVLGASEVILVGVDLSYPDRRHHASGITLIPGEKLEGFIEIPSPAGSVISDPYFLCNVEEISQAAADGLRIVQTSPKGAFIKGAVHRPLEGLL